MTPSFIGRSAVMLSGPAEHPLGLVADGEHLAGGVVERDDAGLVEQDAPAADVDERVGGPEVDRHVTADDAVRHAPCLAGVASFVGRRDARACAPVSRRGCTTTRQQAKRGTASRPAGTPSDQWGLWD
jgi:hypothetical protein